jgi:NADH-quinone oxidoreductase subunit L
MSTPWLVKALLLGTLAPVLWHGLQLLFGLKTSERGTQNLAAFQCLWVAAGALLLFLDFLGRGGTPLEVALPPLLDFHGYQCGLLFLVDGVGLTYVGLAALVYAAVVRFSIPAFHREPRAAAYWMLVMLFILGVITASLAGGIDTLYMGWELVGLCSIGLIGFFRENPRSGENSLRALIYYRICDAALLGALVWIHASYPAADFLAFGLDSQQEAAPWTGLLLLGASLAKAAQLPMSPWLHRAMEGPASSSAIFYGALSVHLGPLLLLRTAPLWQAHPLVTVTCVLVGLLTALFATLVGRTRADAKTSLAFAAMAQLGIIYVEIGLGLHQLALLHVFAHAGLRTWQFLRSSSLIQDFVNNPLMGADVRLRLASEHWLARLSPRLAERLYVLAQRQFWIDALQWRGVAAPFLAFFEALARLEDRLSGHPRGPRR